MGDIGISAWHGESACAARGKATAYYNVWRRRSGGGRSKTDGGIVSS